MKSEITTTTEPPRQKQSALATMAAKYHVEPAALLSTLKDTAFKGATDSQMMALCVVANEYGLNPFTKEIYAFPDSKSGGIVPIIGVDGWYRIVNDNPAFDGARVRRFPPRRQTGKHYLPDLPKGPQQAGRGHRIPRRMQAKHPALE
jgi:hypothetical protein